MSEPPAELPPTDQLQFDQAEFAALNTVATCKLCNQPLQKGCQARGGWFYQALAMFLTYTAIVLTYIPPLIQMIQKGPNADAAAQAQPGQPVGAPQKAAAGGPAGNQEPARGGPLYYAIMAVIMTIVAFAVPIMAGLEHPIGLLIVGIGLYEAWVINKRAPLLIGGPYQIGSATAGA